MDTVYNKSSIETLNLKQYDNDNLDSVLNSQKIPTKFGIRHLHAVLMFLGLAVVFGCRLVLSVSIVAMTNNTTNPDFVQLNWDEPTQGIIFSSSYWGFMPSNLIGAFVVQRYGGKLPLLLCVFGISLFTILTPLIAIQSWIHMCVKQMAEGLLSGFAFTSVFNLLGKWVHPLEREIIVPITVTGATLGVIFTMFASGFIASSRLGWPGTFYIPGAVGILWSIIWIQYGRKMPSDCKILSKEERLFLESISDTSSSNNLKTPWKRILTSKPVWGQILSTTGLNWGFTLLLVVMPTYIKEVLGFDIESNGLLSTIPFITMFVVAIGVSYWSKYLVKNEIISTLNARKLFNTLGMCVPAFSLIILSFVSNNILVAIIFFSLALGFTGAVNASVYISPLDIAPNYAGAISGLSNFIGTISSILSPLSFGYIVTDTKDLALWRIVFLIAAAFFLVGDIIYIIYIESEVQDWNFEDGNGRKNESQNHPMIKSIQLKVISESTSKPN